MLAALHDCQLQTERLTAALRYTEQTTQDALRHSDWLKKRAQHLDHLSSPASDASSTLNRAHTNLRATLILLKDAREKFDTVLDCEPAMVRLHQGVADMEALSSASMSSLNINSNRNNNSNNSSHVGGATKLKAALLTSRTMYTEQDVFAACDSMEILRDAFTYFDTRRHWKSAASTLMGLERCHKLGLDAMCNLITMHMKQAGPAVRSTRKKTKALPDETAEQTRTRLASALLNRDLLKSIGEYEEFQPVETRPIREIMAVYECLGSHGYTLGSTLIITNSNNSSSKQPPGLAGIFGVPPQKVIRTEKVGSGIYSAFVHQPLETGFPQLDAFGEARRDVAYNVVDAFYRKLKADRKRRWEKRKMAGATTSSSSSLYNADSSSNNNNHVDAVHEADTAARDAVRCLEHAMIVAAGEKAVYRAIVSLSLARYEDYDDDDYEAEEVGAKEVSPFYKKACAGSYSHVVGGIVNRTLDIFETVYLKEGGIGQASGSSSKPGGVVGGLTVVTAACAAAAGLRMLDGVRMLGPSLAKLCEMPINDGLTDANSSLAAILCIALHRTTVKNTARTLENLAKAIQDDPLKGPLHRPKDASISSVSEDVVFAIRLIAPFVSAYKTVSKRRALLWDPNMGDGAGELDSFVRFLVMRLLNSLKGKAVNYTKDGRDGGQARSNLFMLNNAFYLLEELGPNISISTDPIEDKEVYRIDNSWFVDKINKLMDSEKSKYLGHWESLNKHLSSVGDLEYQKNDTTFVSYDSGKLIKQRFTGFNEEFEKTFELHRTLCIVDRSLRLNIQQEVAKVFLPRYRRFFEIYTKIRFSKKHMDEYTKYSPDKIEDMLFDMYTDSES